MRFPSLLAALFIIPGTVMAQSALTKQDAQKMVLGLYIVDIAADVCDLDLTKDEAARLEFWIEWAEKQLDIADRKLEKTYDNMMDEAAKDKYIFCAKVTPAAQRALKELPPAP